MTYDEWKARCPDDPGPLYGPCCSLGRHDAEHPSDSCDCACHDEPEPPTR